MINIEDDVKILKKFNSLKVNSPFRFVEISYPRLQKAISNILSDYTRQKQINEEHQKINGELREKVKELEEKNRIFALEGSRVKLELYIKENYIPKQVVKDLMENETIDISGFECIAVEDLQELLGGEIHENRT